MSEYPCGYCNREFGSQKALDSHVGQIHPETFPWNDEETLRHEYVEKEKSTAQLADEWGCSKQTIGNACERSGIPLRERGGPTEYPELADGDWLRDAYEGRGLSAAQIAEEVGSTKSAVDHSLRRHGVEGRQYGHHLIGATREEHPTWKGGHEENRGYSWPERREAALDRDGHECQRCGMSSDEHLAEYSQDIHVHHIIRYGEFESSEIANRLCNLVTLCRPCHDELEGEPPTKQIEFVKAKGRTVDEACDKHAAALAYLETEVLEDVRAMQPGKESGE